MPCYTVRTVTLALEVADQGVLVRGLKAAGYRVSVDGGIVYAYAANGERVVIKGGKITMEGAAGYVEAALDRHASAVKQAYAKEAIRTAAQKYGFNLKQDAKSAQHLTLTRRTF